MVNVGYGTIFYSFGVLLGGVQRPPSSGALQSVSLGFGVLASGALAPLVGTFSDLRGPRWVYFGGSVLVVFKASAWWWVYLYVRVRRLW